MIREIDYLGEIIEVECEWVEQKGDSETEPIPGHWDITWTSKEVDLDILYKLL